MRFWFTLALALGKTVSELQSTMGAYEFAMWEEYYKIDPFGNERGDLQAGIVASAAVAPYSKKPIKPSEFMPDFLKADKPTQDYRVAKAVMLQYGALHNKRLGVKPNG